MVENGNIQEEEEEEEMAPGKADLILYCVSRCAGFFNCTYLGIGVGVLLCCLWAFLSVCFGLSLPVSLSVCLGMYMSMYVPNCMSVLLCVCPSMCPCWCPCWCPCMDTLYGYPVCSIKLTCVTRVVLALLDRGRGDGRCDHKRDRI